MPAAACPSVVALSIAIGFGAPARAQGPGAELFEREVLPILTARCLECHGGGERLRGGLRLTSRAGVLAGGDGGPAVDLDEPAASRLLAMVSYRDEHHRMPPAGKLPQAELALLERWVLAGAPWSESIEIEERAAAPRASLGREDGLSGWSYRPLERPPVPQVQGAAWVRNPIDAFVLARLEELGLEPAPPAGSLELLRRVGYALTGLPPEPEEVRAFLEDEQPNAYERLVDRLLASPHYGEHQARRWLDLVRYAETNGYERDTDKPYAWRYRDWVVEALNEDLPYDRFVLEQLAGDELDVVTAGSLTATGYLRLMVWDDEPGQGVLQARYDTLDDLVSTTGQAFLGMTLGCARCHDHKADPIPQADYFRFLAFFHGMTDMGTEGVLADVSTEEERAAREAAERERDAAVGELEAQLLALEERLRARVAAVEEASAAASPLRGLRYRFYRDTWERLPDFDALRAEDEGELPGGRIDVSPATRAEAYGFVFEGELVVLEGGEHELRARVQDGLRLWIGDQLVLERDGIHDRVGTLRGAIELARGVHALRLETFHTRGDRTLEVGWRRAGADRWRATSVEPPAGWTAPGFDDSAWSEGEGGFGTRGTPGARVGTVWDGPAIWLRRRFEWDGGDPVLVLHHDEDVEVHVNGVPAFEARGHRKEYGLFELAPAARAALAGGTNVLALACRQNGGGQFVHAAIVPRALARGAASIAPLRGRGLADLAAGLRSWSAGAARALAPEELFARHAAEHLDRGERARHAALANELAEWRARELPPRRRVLAVQEHGPAPPPLHVHVRGNAHVLGEAVEPGFPRALGGGEPSLPAPALDARSSGRRRALAEWIVDPANPATARVQANRVWQSLFGRGIVRTPNDFGELGERPTHPELLDWLACELVARGWSTKELQRLILASSAFRMSSRASERARERDPANERFSRFDLRRLSAEELRDSMLALNGRLDRRVGGASFFEPLPAAVLATSSTPGEVWGRSPEAESWRRSLYIKVKRSLVTPLLSVFDFPDTDSSCAARFSTTTPLQSLALLNGAFANEQAAAFAERLAREAGPSRAARVRLALALATGREPGREELRDGERFLARLVEEHGASERRALELWALVTYNLNEFLHVD